MNLEKEHLIHLYTLMVRTRKFDILMCDGIKEGKLVSFFHSGQGEEAISAGSSAFAVKENDYLYPHHRSHGIGWHMAQGVSPLYWVAQHYGTVLPEKPPGPTLEDRGIFGRSGTIGGMFVLAAGWGLSAQKNGGGQICVCLFGDGASGRGTLHEAMNFAAVKKLPIVWVCENNGYGQWMPITDAYAREDIADLAAGYGMPGVVVDGQDVVAVHEAVYAASERARKGDGPSLVECKTFRLGPHNEGGPDVSHSDPRSKELIESWRERDPILLFREKLLKQGVMTDGDVARIDSGADAEVAAADEYCTNAPRPVVEGVAASALNQRLFAD